MCGCCVLNQPHLPAFCEPHPPDPPTCTAQLTHHRCIGIACCAPWAQANPKKKGKGKASPAFAAAADEYELMGEASDGNAFIQVLQDAEAAEAAKRSLRPAKVRQPPGPPAGVAGCDGGGGGSRARTPPMPPTALPAGFWGAGSSDSGQEDSE